MPKTREETIAELRFEQAVTLGQIRGHKWTIKVEKNQIERDLERLHWIDYQLEQLGERP